MNIPLKNIIINVIRDNNLQTQTYRNSDVDRRKKLLGFFIGQVMKETKGNCNPKEVNELLTEYLDSEVIQFINQEGKYGT